MSLSSGLAAAGGTRVGAAPAPSGTSTTTETGTSTVITLLSWNCPELLSAAMLSGAEVSHSPPVGRVLRNSSPSEMRRQTRTSTFAVVSTVRVAANAPSAPPMAIAAIIPARISRFVRFISPPSIRLWAGGS